MEMDDVLKGADWLTLAGEVQVTYSEHFAQYSYTKYPAQDYQRFKQTFSAFKPDVELDLALLWKWGTGGRPTIPGSRGC